MNILQCPECSSDRYSTPGINYVRQCDNKHKYKVCPFCKLIFEVSLFECSRCGAWLPSLPTSWARSATSLFLLRRVAENIYRLLNNSSDNSSLAQVLASMGLISVNPQKIDVLGDVYWKGTVMRRASEYSTNLKYLGFLEKKDGKDSLTFLGKRFVSTKTKLDFDSVAILSLMLLRLTNKHDIRRTYIKHNIKPIFLSLKLIGALQLKRREVSVDHIALAFMCRDEVDDFKKALKMSEKFSAEYIHNLFFSNGKEFNRAIIGVFSNWMEQVGLIKRERSLYGIRAVSLTKTGIAILKEFESMNLRSVEIDLEKCLEFVKKIILKNSEDKNILSVVISRGAKIGGEWEEEVLKLLKKIGYIAEKYSDNRIFAKTKLSEETLNALPGGSLHNPDIIIKKNHFY